jgi:hypothetical protein
MSKDHDLPHLEMVKIFDLTDIKDFWPLQALEISSEDFFTDDST